jgi:hypothetical protein
LTVGRRFDVDAAVEKVYPRDLLDGLIDPSRLYVVVPSDQYPHDLLARPTYSGR